VCKIKRLRSVAPPREGVRKFYFHGKYYGGVYDADLLDEFGILELTDEILKVRSDFDIEKIKKFYKKGNS